jgi:hypothetical protein
MPSCAVSFAKPIIPFESRICAYMICAYMHTCILQEFPVKTFGRTKRREPREAKGDGEVDLLALQRGACLTPAGISRGGRHAGEISAVIRPNLLLFSL